MDTLNDFRSSLLNGIASKFDRFEEKYKEQLEQHARHQSLIIELEELRARASRVETLEQENIRLQDELNALKDARSKGLEKAILDHQTVIEGEQVAQSAHGSASTKYAHLGEKYNTVLEDFNVLQSTHEILVEQHEHLKDVVNSLDRKNNVVSEELKAYRKAYGVLRSQHRRQKERVNEWLLFTGKLGMRLSASDSTPDNEAGAIDKKTELHGSEAHTAAIYNPLILENQNALDSPVSPSKSNQPSRSNHQLGEEYWSMLPKYSTFRHDGSGHGERHLEAPLAVDNETRFPSSELPLNSRHLGTLQHQVTDNTASLIHSSSTTSSGVEDSNVADPNGIGNPHVSNASDEVPIVVSSRFLKRKRRQDVQPTDTAQQDTEAPGSAATPVQIKSEPGSSSPIRSMILQNDRNGPETQDLDEIGGVIRTPRKHQDRSTNLLNFLPRIEESGRALSEPTDTSQFHKRHFEASRPNRALQPLDKNSGRVLGLLDRDEKRPEKKMRTDGGAAAIHILSEDAEEYDVKPTSRNGEHGADPTRAHSREPSGNRRLIDLLEGRSHVNDHPLATPAVRKRKLHQTKTSAAKIPPHDAYLTPQQTPGNFDASTVGTFRTQKHILDTSVPSKRRWPLKTAQDSTVDNASHILPEHEPLRARPVRRLTLEHFRINPSANQGLTYAFTDVVRKRDERKCLPGCMRPECCGAKFRSLVKMGGFPTAPMNARGIFDSLPPAATDSYGMTDQDLRILQEYMGDAATPSRLDNLTPEEREDLLIDAKAKKLANMYGKHRHQHERAQTPPGFWRTDMPDSQELEQDREEAQEMVRRKVKERWREAMRPGGVWKFADE